MFRKNFLTEHVASTAVNGSHTWRFGSSGYEVLSFAGNEEEGGDGRLDPIFRYANDV